jgi:hypothetical protein
MADLLTWTHFVASVFLIISRFNDLFSTAAKANNDDKQDIYFSERLFTILMQYILDKEKLGKGKYLKSITNWYFRSNDLQVLP